MSPAESSSSRCKHADGTTIELPVMIAEQATRYTSVVGIEEEVRKGNATDTKDELSDATQHQQSQTSARGLLCIFFLGFSAIGPIAIGFISVAGGLMAIAVDVAGPNTTIVQYKWIVSGYAIGACASFPLAGSLSDIFGRRWVILAGNILCTIGGIVGAAAGSLAGLITAEVLFGIATGLVLTAYAAIPELCPRRLRGLGLAWLEVCINVPFNACSVLLAQTIVHSIGWRWFFLLPIIVSTVAFSGIALLYFPVSYGGQSKLKRFLALDFVALALLLAGLTTFLVGLSWAGLPDHSWQSASVIASLVIGATLCISAFIYDFFAVDDEVALLPLSLFRMVRKYTLTLVAVFAAGFCYYPMAALTPQTSTWIFTPDPTRLGLIQLSPGLGTMFGAVAGPALLHLTRYPKGHIIAALSIQATFTGLLSWTLPNHQTAWMAFLFFSSGTFSWVTVSCIINSGLHIDHARLGLATSLISTFRSLGGGFGNAVLTTVYIDTLESVLEPHIVKASASVGFNASDPAIAAKLINASQAAALGAPHAFRAVAPISSQVQQAVLTAFRQAQAVAFGRTFYVAAAFAGVGLMAALFVEDASSKLDGVVAARIRVRGKLDEPAGETKS